MNMIHLIYICDIYIYEMYISYPQTNKITQDNYIPNLRATLSQQVVGLKEIFISASAFPVELSLPTTRCFWH